MIIQGMRADVFLLTQNKSIYVEWKVETEYLVLARFFYHRNSQIRDLRRFQLAAGLG